MKMSGVLVEKVLKTYFVGVAWTLFTPLRDTISVSNNRIIFSGITLLGYLLESGISGLYGFHLS